MRQMMVRYTVKPGESERNAELVRNVYAELNDTKPEGFRYATFRLDDGRTFVHVAATEGDGTPLQSTKAFGEFQAGLSERCEDQPVFAEYEEIGSYGLR